MTAASNYTSFKGSQVASFKVGGTAFSAADYASTTVALDTSFASNNATILIDLVGSRDANSPVKSEAFAKDITHSGNERNIIEEDLLGSDSNSTQNKEIIGSNVSMLQVEATLVYRNNVPLSIFNDSTKCALIEIDNNETSTTGRVNRAYNNIIMKKVGDETLTSDGLSEQKVVFTLKAGTTGSPIAVSTGSETWSKVVGGNYAEEVQLS